MRAAERGVVFRGEGRDLQVRYPVCDAVDGHLTAREHDVFPGLLRQLDERQQRPAKEMLARIGV
jgi:hypothetical protein